MSWKSIFFSAKGRIRRSDFWIAWLLITILSAVLGLFGLVGDLAAVLLVYPQVCLFSGRLHDLGRSGWFTALPAGLGAAGGVTAGFLEPLREAGAGGPLLLVGSMVVVVCMIAALVLFLRTGLARGQAEANVYGPAPPAFFRSGPAGEAA
jgi:uncharacterized membrane protein YhaH (DUF805 family)